MTGNRICIGFSYETNCMMCHLFSEIYFKIDDCYSRATMCVEESYTGISFVICREILITFPNFEIEKVQCDDHLKGIYVRKI